VKLNNHHIQAKSGDMEAAGLSVTSTTVPEKSAIARAIHFHFSSRYIIPRFIIPLVSCAIPGLALAAPEGGQVVAGTASISNPDANTTLITQTTVRTAIDWQRFNIGAHEYVQFVQPDASSVALNQVIGGDPSQILGNLSANGQVFLVNPNGVYFGHSATVDVGGIVASVHNISTQDFMSGNYLFSKADDAAADAGIVNDGVITAHDGGYVVLMGDYIHNNGVISARLGTVALAAGKQITMDVKANGLVSVAIDEASLSAMAGVNNSGEIIAAGGRVMMTAKVANDLIDTAINNQGLVLANSITERNGVIYLAAAGGDVVNSGTLDASAKHGSGVDGGVVIVHSDNDITNTSGGQIKAKGDGSGNGGVVRVIAEQHMAHESGALIDVTSDNSNQSAEGGFVELSGHGSLAIRGDVDIGMGGELLIDPAILTIARGVNPPSSTSGLFTVGETFIENQLNTGVDVTLIASDEINASTSLSIDAITVGAGDLAIKIGSISTGGGTLGSGSAGACSLVGFCVAGTTATFVPDADGSIDLWNVSFNLAGGLTVAGGTNTGDVRLGDIIKADGGVSVTAGSSSIADVRLGNVTTGASLNVSAGGNVDVGSSDAGGGDIDATGDVSISAGRNISMYGRVTQAGTSFNVVAAGNINLNNDIGSSVSPLAANVSLTGNQVNINADIHLANNNLALTGVAVGTTTSAIISGQVNIQGQYGEQRTISTQGDLIVRGDQLTVRGADAPTFFVTPVDSALTIQAANIDIDVTQDVNVSGGNFTPTSATGAGTADVSVHLSASNNISITARTLNVQGGNATANNSFGGGSLTVRSQASINAGNDLTLNLANDLTISGGNAVANAFATNSATAEASAEVMAGRNLIVTAMNVNLAAGSETVTGTGIVAANSKSKLIAIGGNLAVNAGANLNANSASISAANDVSITVAGDVIENTSNSWSAGANISVVAGNNYHVNGGYSAGNSVSLSAGNTLDLNIDFGSSGVPINHDLALAGRNLIIDQNIHLANHSLTLSGQSGTGSISILGSSSAPLTVETQGILTITGNNLIVKDTTTPGGTGTSASVNVTANIFDIVLTGNMDISAGSLASGAGGASVSVNASVTATDNVTITAQNLTVNGGTARADTATGVSQQYTANAKLEAGGDMSLNIVDSFNVNGGNASANASTPESATAEANAEIITGGNLMITAANVNLGAGSETTIGTGTVVADAKAKLSSSGSMSVVVSGDITADKADITANGLYMAAGNNIDLLTSNISVGTGTVEGVFGDAITLAFLANQGIPPPSTANPNAKFSAGGTLTLTDGDSGSLTMDGDIPYLWLEADTVNIGGLSLPDASDVVVQYSAFTKTASIGVETGADDTTGQTVNFNNLDHFAFLPGTTIIIGDALHTGDIVIADVDILAKNMVAVTAAKVDSISNVISTGIVAELIIGAIDNEFVIPVLTEVEVDLDLIDDLLKEKRKKKDLIEDDEAAIKMCEAG